MASVTVSQPRNLQLQSPLLRLPGEIRNLIYQYCFTAHGPVVDPAVRAFKSPHTTARIPGIVILYTCRAIYHEADRRQLYSHVFRSTSVNRIRCFLKKLSPADAATVQAIEIDARKVHSMVPGVAVEWLRDLAAGYGGWTTTLESLSTDAPSLKVLRLNVEAWPALPMFRVELWRLLRALLRSVTGLKRIVVIGASKGCTAENEPWSPVHFVGEKDVLAPDDLIPCMWSAVGQSDDEAKIIRWTRSEGKVFLEVVTRTYLQRVVDCDWTSASLNGSSDGPLPKNGSCTWSFCQNRTAGSTPDLASQP